MGIVSYAQNFEDVVLWRVLHDVTPGVYIDVGAHHPVVDSVSKAFYEQGWRGIHVEPTVENANLLREDRPDEPVVQAIVAEQSGVVRFYEIPGTGLSTARQDIAEEHQNQRGFPVQSQVVTAVTLDEVLALAPSDDIHWLKIDVEGFEREVLAGWQASPRRPWVVVMESTYPNTTRDTYQDWEVLILAKGYRLVYRDGLNRYYLHELHAAREERFTFPPNVFDGFQLNGTATSFTPLLVQRHRAAEAATAVERDLVKEENSRLNASQELLQAQLHDALGQAQLLDHALEQSRLKQATEVDRLESLLQTLRYEAQHARSEAIRLQEVTEKRLAEADAQHAGLRQLADEAVKAQFHAATDQLKQRAELERQYLAKLDAAHDAWRQSLEKQHCHHAEQLRSTLQQIHQQHEAEVKRIEGQKDHALMELDGLKRHLLQLQERWSDIEDQNRKKFESLTETAHKKEQQIAERLTRDHRTALEEVRKHHRAQQVKLEFEFGRCQKQLESARQQVLALQKSLAERERQHSAKLDALQKKYLQQETERAAMADRAMKEALARTEQQHERERQRWILESEAARSVMARAIAAEQTLQQSLMLAEREHASRLNAVHEAWRNTEVDLRQRHAEEVARLNESLCQVANECLAKHEALKSERFEPLEQAVNQWRERAEVQARLIEQLSQELIQIRSSLTRRVAIFLGKHLKKIKLKANFYRWSLGQKGAGSMLVKDGLQYSGSIEIDVQGNQHCFAGRQSSYSFCNENMKIREVSDLFLLHGEEFLQATYQTLLSRSPDPEGRTYYLGCLRRGEGRISVIAQIALSKEAKSHSPMIPGLEALLTQHKKQNHWLMGWWYRKQATTYAMHRIEESMAHLHSELASLRRVVGLCASVVDKPNTSSDVSGLVSPRKEVKQGLAESDSKERYRAYSEPTLEAPIGRSGSSDLHQPSVHGDFQQGMRSGPRNVDEILARIRAELSEMKGRFHANQ